MEASRAIELPKMEPTVEKSNDGSNTKSNGTQKTGFTEESPNKAPNFNSPKRLAMKVKSWGKENKTASRVPFPMTENPEKRVEEDSNVQPKNTGSDERRMSSTSSRKTRMDTKVILRMVAFIEQQLLDTEIDQDYKEYMIERRQSLLDSLPQVGQPENLWQRLEVIFDAVRSVGQGLTDSPEDKSYRQHLLRTGLLLDVIPPQYLDHLEKIRDDIILSDPPSDPWIQNWSKRRLTNSNYSKKYLIERWACVKSGNVEKVLVDREDLVSFGKRASIMEFSDRSGLLFRGIPPAPPSRIRPRVSEVICLDSLYTKRRSGLRWIHLPANNMSWVEVRISPHYALHLLTNKRRIL